MRCPELIGPRVVLRSWREHEAAWYVAARDEEVFRWTSERRDLTLEGARVALADALHVPDGYGFVIADRETGELIGHLPVGVEHETADLAYWLAPSTRGHGYAAEALALVVAWLPDIGCRRAVLEVHPDNTASRRLAERVGFTEVGEVSSSKQWADAGRAVLYEMAVAH